MGFFEVTKVSRSGKTGRRIGIVKAKSMYRAVNLLHENKKMPKRVRVFKVKLIKRR